MIIVQDVINIERLADDLMRALRQAQIENKRQRQLSASRLWKQCGKKKREKRI